MAPSKAADYRTSAGMKEILCCEDIHISRLEVAVRCYINDRIRETSKVPYVRETYKAIAKSDRVIDALLSGFFGNAERQLPDNFYRALEEVKNHLYHSALRQVQTAKSKGQSVSAQKRQEKRRWSFEQDQDDDEPSPVKKTKTEAESPTEAQRTPAAHRSATTQSLGMLGELLKTQAQKSADETIKVVEAHIELAVKAQVEKQVRPREQCLLDGQLALAVAESRLKERETRLAEAEAEQALKKTEETDTMIKREEDLMKREETVAELQEKNAKLQERNAHVQEMNAMWVTRCGHLDAKLKLTSEHLEQANEKQARLSDLAAKHAKHAKAVEDFKRAIQ